MKKISVYLAVLTFLILAAISFHITEPGGVAGGDEAEYLAVAYSIVNDRDIDLKNQADIFELHPKHQKETYLKKFQTQEEHTFFPSTYIVNAIPQKNKLLPYHPLGLSLLITPGMALSGIWGARLTIILCAALLASILYKLTKSLFLTTILIFSPPLLYFSLLVFSEIPAALLLTYSYLNLTRKTNKKKNKIGTALALSFLPWLHPKYTLLSIIALIYLYTSKKVKWFHQILIALTSSTLTLIIFYTTVYKDPLAWTATGHPGFINPLKGAAGLLFDRTHGLVTNAPLYLLTIIAFIKKAKYPNQVRSRQQKKVNNKDWLRSALIIAVFAGNSIYANWHGGATPAGRLLVPILPLFGSYLTGMIKKDSPVKILAVTLLTSLGAALAVVNLFFLKNLGFSSAEAINEAYFALPYGEALQKLFPTLVK
ncbi:MAG: hypothetical protein ACOC4Z_02065 [Patescibacteria group bacterium]